MYYFCAMSNGLREYFPECESAIRRGRSTELLSRRNDKIAARFYYYSNIKRYSYRITLEFLSIEFDLRERVVEDSLKSNRETLDKLFSEKPSVAELKRRIPYMVWG